jgi:hypothetical protein
MASGVTIRLPSLAPARVTHRLRVASRHIRRALWRHVGRFLAANHAHYARSERRTEYLVLWQIYVEADTPEDAASQALAAQRSVDSDATAFDVRDEWGRWRTVVCTGGDAAAGLGPVRHRLGLVKTSTA